MSHVLDAAEIAARVEADDEVTGQELMDTVLQLAMEYQSTTGLTFALYAYALSYAVENLSGNERLEVLAATQRHFGPK